MTTRPDPDLEIAAWLQAEAPDRAPERLLRASRDRIQKTHQRRAWWPARRVADMNTLKLAIAAVAVVVVAVLGINLLPRQGGVGGPGSSPTPSPSPILNFTGSFAPGTTYAIDDPCCVGTSRVVFTIPATGWSALDPVFIDKDLIGFGPTLIDNLYTGGCHWRWTAQVPPIGPTVDDLAAALTAQAGPGAAPPTALTVGGRPGKKVELSIPADVDVSTCDSDHDLANYLGFGRDTVAIFGRWYTYAPDGINAAQPYTHNSNGQHDTVYIVDVDGTRQVIDSWYPPSASAADRAELEKVITSIRFEPRPASPSPSP